MAYSPKLAEVLGGPQGILDKVSGAVASRRVHASGGALSDTTILAAKRGDFGRIESVAEIARAYARDLVAHEKWRAEIEQTYGRQATEQLAIEWLQHIAKNPDGLPGGALPPTLEIDEDLLRRIVEMVAPKVAQETADATVRRLLGDSPLDGKKLQLTGR
jgi:hypothetical protein